MIRIQARGPSEAEILIHEVIGENWFGDGLTSKKFAEQLAKLGDVAKIVVRINSPGGAVHDGVAIYNALRNHGARIEVVVEGLAASIASIIAMSGDNITMNAGAMMMIHCPWTIAFGSADDMRKCAEILEKHEEALLDIYAKRTGVTRDDIHDLLKAETWFTSNEAVEHGFADEAETEDEATKEGAETARASHRESFTQFLAEFKESTAKLTPLQIAAALKSATSDATQETSVKSKANASPTDADQQIENQVSAEQLEAARREGAAAESQRRKDITDKFGKFATGNSELLSACLADVACTAQMAGEKLLAELGKRHSPIVDPGASDANIQPGEDEKDKRTEAATNAVLARIGSGVYDPNGKKDKFPAVDNSNPYRGFSLFDLAEDAVRRMGIATRGKNRSQIVAAAFGHTTSDFPNLLENVMHKLLIVSYQGAEVTWHRIARIGDLTDFRAHPRYRFGTFSDIQEVNQAGNYVQGTISDAEKESITAKRKGRILVVTRELVVNDDLQALSDAARGLGRAASRTIDKDLYALFASNGPTMGDSVALFNGTTTGHKNIAVTAAVPTTASVDAARVQMAKQLDPSGNDFVGLRPAIVLAPLALGSAFRTLNEAQYDPIDSKFQKPNVVRGLFRDVVDSPRLDALSAQIWYVLADPNEEPVFEVGFLGGVREPRVEQEQEFSSDSLQWKVVHEYGVAAIGWRGIIKNAGA